MTGYILKLLDTDWLRSMQLFHYTNNRSVM